LPSEGRQQTIEQGKDIPKKAETATGQLEETTSGIASPRGAALAKT
jgi:hypothetical protein